MKVFSSHAAGRRLRFLRFLLNLATIIWTERLFASQAFIITPSQPPIHHQLRASPADARGSAVLLEDVSVYCGPARVLSKIDWRVEPRTKWALVGANGAGKSTLLKAIADDIPYDGRIAIGSSPIGFLRQTAVAGSNKTIYDETSSGMWRINQAKEEMRRAEEIADLDAIEKATTRFESLGGYQQEQKVNTVLKGLGFSSDSYHTTRCDQLSGGWQMRVAFARQLLSEPSLSLLDEPGNHLDDAAKRWLANYLAKYQGDGAMILVTHDVELLKSMDHIAEVIPGAAGLQIYKSCNYERYLELKQQRAAAAITEYERNKEKAAQLQAFVDRFGASATKASAAQSRVKQIEKMRQQGLLDAPPDAVVAQRFKPRMNLPKPPLAMGEVLLSLSQADLGHTDTPLVRGASLEIKKGMIILVRGPNGSGKSTLLHSLRGSLPLLAGERNECTQLQLGMFTQDLAQELDPNARAVDIVTSYAREGNIHIAEQEARGTLGALGLKGEKALCRLGDLSGGEKSRVALAMFALKPSNVYFLDEPSNHLDAECVEALGEALRGWDGKNGAIVVVSHDRHFCSAVDFSHVVTVDNGSLVTEERASRKSDWTIRSLSSSTQNEDDDYKPSNQLPVVDSSQRKRAYNAPKRIAKLEKLIEETETKIGELDNEMMQNGSNVEKLISLTKSKDALVLEVDEYMTEWEELETIMATI